MSALEELLQKDCPFEPWQFIEAREVLEWLWNNVNDAELQKWHMEGVHDRLNYYLFNYSYYKMGMKPISRCSIAELEQEIQRRNKEKDNEYCAKHCKGFQQTGRCYSDGRCKDYWEHQKTK